MSIKLNFKPIEKPIMDIDGEVVDHGYELVVPHELLEQFNFNCKIKLYCPTADFKDFPVMLHAWTLNKDEELVKKETHISSSEWFELMGNKRRNSIPWPNVDQGIIASFKYDLFLVIEPSLDSISKDFTIKLETDK